MLEFVESILSLIQRAANNSDVSEILAELSQTMSFRSGLIIEYGDAPFTFSTILDSNSERSEYWEGIVGFGLHDNLKSFSHMLNTAEICTLDASRFNGEQDPAYKFALERDLLDCVVVPVSHEGNALGAAIFSGNAALNEQEKFTLQVMIYCLFSQMRVIHAHVPESNQIVLTPRQKQVLLLVTEGLTSQDISTVLGMSPRTVNQHIENIALKLGTRNRVHTASLAIRSGLVH